MRINKWIANASSLSRRAADTAIANGRVWVNGKPAQPGQEVSDTDIILLAGRQLEAPRPTQTVLFNKPVGYVVSRDGQGSQTIYDLLPNELRPLNPVGRLDKDSSGLLLLTSDGQLAQELTHPKYEKMKVYEIRLGRALPPLHRQMIAEKGIQLNDGLSKLALERMHEGDDRHWRIRMHEGRNRQIRRTFASLGYAISTLHRTHFGDYTLGDLASGAYRDITSKNATH
ncbi:MAG TPA: pseudouridine synthase [Patescibacteria group bacterium]|nr:pseudouridine synthase [Patescibacteria group bacterium]